MHAQGSQLDAYRRLVAASNAYLTHILCATSALYAPSTQPPALQAAKFQVCSWALAVAHTVTTVADPDLRALVAAAGPLAGPLGMDAYTFLTRAVRAALWLWRQLSLLEESALMRPVYALAMVGMMMAVLASELHVASTAGVVRAVAPSSGAAVAASPAAVAAFDCAAVLAADMSGDVLVACSCRSGFGGA